MDEIVNTVYGVASRKLDYAHTLSNVDAALDKLSTWQAELPLVLQLQADSTIPDRANLILHMMFNQVSVFEHVYSFLLSLLIDISISLSFCVLGRYCFWP